MTQHQLKVRKDVYKLMTLTFVAVLLINVMYRHLKAQAEFADPRPEHDAIVLEKEVLIDTPDQNIDAWIGYYADKFANKDKNASYLRYQLHCLANKESGHRHNNHTKCGDNSKSCGLYQFRQATWTGMRKIMMREGLITEIGSLWNNKQAVETTSWALANGRENNWGPIVNRGACR